MLDADDITPLVIDPLVVNDPAFNAEVPSLNVAPNTWPRAETLEADDITPLVIDPLIVSEPDFNVAVPSLKVALITVADVDSEPAFSVAVPSVTVAPNT